MYCGIPFYNKLSIFHSSFGFICAIAIDFTHTRTHTHKHGDWDRDDERRMNDERTLSRLPPPLLLRLSQRTSSFSRFIVLPRASATTDRDDYLASESKLRHFSAVRHPPRLLLAKLRTLSCVPAVTTEPLFFPLANCD